jgi:hypothetical protein
MSEKPRERICVSSIVLGVLGLVMSFLLPAAAYGCSIPGLALGASKYQKSGYNSRVGIALNIVALAVALINSAMGVIMTVKMYVSHSKDKKSVELSN